MNEAGGHISRVLNEPQFRVCVDHVTALCTSESPVAFWASVYLMRLLCRKYAYSFLQLLLDSEMFSFLTERVKSSKQRPDAFIIYGADYIALRTIWINFIYTPINPAVLDSQQRQTQRFTSELNDALARTSQPVLNPLITFLSLVPTFFYK